MCSTFVCCAHSGHAEFNTLPVRTLNALYTHFIRTLTGTLKFQSATLESKSDTLWRLAGILSQLCPREKQKSEKITKQNKTKQTQM